MRLARLYITVILAIRCLGASCDETSTSEESNTSGTELTDVDDVEEYRKIVRDNENDTLKIASKNPRDLNDEQLPILPPIILLDFANDPDNATGVDEKSKRTIDNNLGYGFARNNLFAGKYNYYFPAGKSGTTVSIEESISPFLPKTIIETVKPITEKPLADESSNVYGRNPLIKSNYQTISGSRVNGQNVQTSNNRLNAAQTVFGQRTKLYKPSEIDYNAYQTFSTTPKSIVNSYPTSGPDYRQNSHVSNQNSYVTTKQNFVPNSYSNEYFPISQTTQRPYQDYTTRSSAYVTPTSSYQTLQPVNNYGTSRPSYESPTTRRPIAYQTESPFASFAHLPRYTIENGVRYENKIVWKYPDGKISQTPPSSYVNAYNEFLARQKPGVASLTTSDRNVATGNYQSVEKFANTNYQSAPMSHRLTQPKNRYQTETFGNIYSKSPAQFPNDQPMRMQRPSQFVTAPSLDATNYRTSETQSENYETSYGEQYGQKTRVDEASSGYSGTFNDEKRIVKDSYGTTSREEQRPISKYAVNSPNPEYTHSTDSPIKTTSTASYGDLFTPSGELSPAVLSKYSLVAQKYLTKVFAGEHTNSRYSNDIYNVTPAPNVATNYENLLNYNPSIGQYVKDPSSILNARPTFIQAGNSLIPVIILRVDGAPPIPSKVTPNINLKALLQRYLTQYAGNIGHTVNYDNGNYGKVSSSPTSVNSPQNPLYELSQLAHSLTQYSQDPSLVNHFAKQLAGNLMKNHYDNSNVYGETSYDDTPQITKNNDPINYGRKTSRQKVKSVQIIDDPRFTSYKVNS